MTTRPAPSAFAAPAPAAGAPQRQPDALDLAIIERLRADPLHTNKAIAAELAVAETTVAQRIRALADHNIMRVVLQRDLATVQFSLLCLAYIRVLSRPVEAVMRALLGLGALNSISATLGDCDILVVIGARDAAELDQVLERDIAAIPGVDAIETELCLSIAHYNAAFGDLAAAHEPTVARSQLDSLDEQIIAPLMFDARISNREIARRLSLSEGAVRQRLKRLEEARLVRLAAVCNPAAFGIAGISLVRIAMAPDRLETAQRTLIAHPAATFVARTAGRSNLVALMSCASDAELARLFDETLRAEPGLQRLDSLKLLSNRRHDYNIAKIA